MSAKDQMRAMLDQLMGTTRDGKRLTDLLLEPTQQRCSYLCNWFIRREFPIQREIYGSQSLQELSSWMLPS